MKINNVKTKFKGLLLFNKYTLIMIFIYFILMVGGTYAYFAYQIEEESAITGNVIAINVELDVELVVGTNGKMVPLRDGALTNALKGVGSTNGACIDNVGNLSCQVYKITLTNTGSRIQHINGTVELYAKEGTGNTYTNLKWRELSNTQTIKSGSIINGMTKSTLVSDLTMESKEEKIWYIAVWISEINGDQLNTDKGLFGGTVTFESAGFETDTALNDANEPNLDSGNLIPVYFDESVGTYGSWMKADSNNANNSWYDYSNKKWANAIIVADSAKKDTYQSATPGTPINDADITAFYVWIPRFKYRVWNINRQGTSEDYYAYPAYTQGIQIEFEEGTGSTGNVVCSYDDRTTESATSLNDSCTVNGTAVVYNTSNLTYGDANKAWYTHPAFNFDGVPKTGFWIGKFETSGTENSSTGIADTPTILPDVSALRYQAVSEQFMSAKNFQNYLPNSTMDAHMLTNLEWGAVAYLTHSTYGLCNGTSCQGVYINNSYGDSCYFTGRSGGAIAGSTALNLVNVYGSSVTTSTAKYNCNGYYNYKGYKLDYSTGAPTTKVDNKLASTTQNITGVYDMSGGAYEYVMGNMVSSSKVFYPSSASNKWNNTDWYDTANNRLYNKYYNSYAYGTNYYNAIAFNRARLGDATAEVLGGTSSSSSWKPGTGGGITGSSSDFVSSSYSWFTRGGNSSSTYSGAFYFYSGNGSGSSYSHYSFRSSLS